jgi:predicted ArsR family transcriptional regulator
VIHNGTATSRAAAESVKPHAATLREQVFEYIDRQSIVGATADEIEADLELSGNTVRPRLVELRRDGRICDSGNTRKTRTGRSAVVYWTLPSYKRAHHA